MYNNGLVGGHDDLEKIIQTCKGILDSYCMKEITIFEAVPIKRIKRQATFTIENINNEPEKS